MTEDVNCPYCGEGNEICHDDGYGYEEDKLHEQQCAECEKIFTYHTSIHFSYRAYKADCLNGSEHKYKKVNHLPQYWPNWVRCTECGHEVRGEYIEGKP